MRRALRRVDGAAGAVGRGLLAGTLGTAAMTVSSAIEMKARSRPASSAPTQAVERALGVKPTGKKARRRLSTTVHWLYGAGWGALRGAIGAAGVRGASAAGLHFLLVWSAELITLPALDVTPPPWRWERAEIAIDVLHHGVYAVTTSATYEALDRSR